MRKWYLFGIAAALLAAAGGVQLVDAISGHKDTRPTLDENRDTASIHGIDLLQSPIRDGWRLEIATTDAQQGPELAAEEELGTSPLAKPWWGSNANPFEDCPEKDLIKTISRNSALACMDATEQDICVQEHMEHALRSLGRSCIAVLQFHGGYAIELAKTDGIIGPRTVRILRLLSRGVAAGIRYAAEEEATSPTGLAASAVDRLERDIVRACSTSRDPRECVDGEVLWSLVNMGTQDLLSLQRRCDIPMDDRVSTETLRCARIFAAHAASGITPVQD